MQIRKILFALLALAVAIAFSPIDSLQASSLMGPGAQPGTENMTIAVKAKAKAKKAPAKKAKAKGKKAKSKGPGRCGPGNFWSKKKRGCDTKMK